MISLLIDVLYLQRAIGMVRWRERGCRMERHHHTTSILRLVDGYGKTFKELDNERRIGEVQATWKQELNQRVKKLDIL